MSLSINNKFTFIDSFQFWGSSLYSLVKNLCKKCFQYMSQGFNSKLLDSVKQRGYYPYEHKSHLEKFKEELRSK